MKLRRNYPCPCGSGDKYKLCCWGKLDWSDILEDPRKNLTEFLSCRGKNLLFLNMIADALQLDDLKPSSSLVEFKRAFTPQAVRKIYEALLVVWPNGQDLDRVLRAERVRTSALYTGFYHPDNLLKSVTRHSLYSDVILFMDPMQFPLNIKDEYNPIVRPQEHRSTALRWVWIWLTLAPWIEAGLVRFIRNPGDFDAELDLEAMRIARRRHDQHPELKNVLDEMDPESDEHFSSYKEQVLLGIPNDALRRKLTELNPGITPAQIDAALAYVQRKRDANPYFVEPLGPENRGEMLQFSTGANHDMAKWTAAITGSHLITDTPVRWKEIEVDRAEAGITAGDWEPFAKAFQGITINFLNDVPIAAAFELRRRGELENLRAFLRGVWRAAQTAEPFDRVNADHLALELHEQVREAEQEWERIGREVMKWVGGTVAGGLVGMSSIATGGAAWVGAGTVVAGLTGLVSTLDEKASFRKHYPAGFFLELKRGKWNPKRA